jgi:hypothetical protein
MGQRRTIFTAPNFTRLSAVFAAVAILPMTSAAFGQTNRNQNFVSSAPQDARHVSTDRSKYDWYHEDEGHDQHVSSCMLSLIRELPDYLKPENSNESISYKLASASEKVAMNSAIVRLMAGKTQSVAEFRHNIKATQAIKGSAYDPFNQVAYALTSASDRAHDFLNLVNQLNPYCPPEKYDVTGRDKNLDVPAIDVDDAFTSKPRFIKNSDHYLGQAVRLTLAELIRILPRSTKSVPIFDVDRRGDFDVLGKVSRSDILDAAEGETFELQRISINGGVGGYFLCFPEYEDGLVFKSEDLNVRALPNHKLEVVMEENPKDTIKPRKRGRGALGNSELSTGQRQILPKADLE